MRAARGILIFVLAFALYFLTVATVNSLPDLYASVSTAEQEERKKTEDWLTGFSEHEYVKNGLATMLSAIGAVAVSALSRKETSTTFEDQVEKDPTARAGSSRSRQVDHGQYVQNVLGKFERLQGNYEATKAELRDTANNLYNVKRFARRQLRLSMIFSVVVCFAIGHIVAAGIQAVVRGWLPFEEQGEPWRFVSLFAQSLALTCFAFGISFAFCRRYYRLTRRADFKSLFLIGGLGLFAAGTLGFLLQSPEAYTLMAQNVAPLPYFGVSILTYLLISKLLVFPAVGVAGAALAGMLKPPAFS